MDLRISAAAAALVAAMPSAGWADLQVEAVLVGLPDGFKVGLHDRLGAVDRYQYIPGDETLQDWSRMLTEEISHGDRRRDPDEPLKAESRSWAAACPGGSSQPVARTVENGFEVSVWMFVCPMKPAANKPETMWMKAVSGQDALYTVRYAFRHELTPEMPDVALEVLGKVKVCDTRSPERACPAGVLPYIPPAPKSAPPRTPKAIRVRA